MVIYTLLSVSYNPYGYLMIPPDREQIGHNMIQAKAAYVRAIPGLPIIGLIQVASVVHSFMRPGSTS